jgi:hypothetical protein
VGDAPAPEPDAPTDELLTRPSETTTETVQSLVIKKKKDDLLTIGNRR